MQKLALLAAVGAAALSLTGAALAQAPGPSAPSLADPYYSDPAHAPVGGFWRPQPGYVPVFKVGGKALPAPDAKGHQLGMPYRPAWRKVVTARYAGDDKGAPYGDPNFSCWPTGTFNDYNADKDVNGVEIVQTPNRVEMIFEYGPTVRWIYADGREHPKGDDLVYTSKGDSIGHWEGDVFVVDTIAVRYEFTLGYHLPHSDQVHFVERFKRIDADTLQIDVTITDPVALTQPVTTTLMYKKSDPTTIQEKLCIEQTWQKQVGNDLVVSDFPRTKKRYGFDLPNPH